MSAELDALIAIFDRIEMDMLVKVAQQFDEYDKLGGSLEWQLRMLDKMGGLNDAMVKLWAKHSKKTAKQIRKMLTRAQRQNLRMNDLKLAARRGVFRVDPERLLETPVFRDLFDTAYKSMDKTFRMIRTKAIQSSVRAYMNIVNTAYVETQSGVFDYATSIRRGVQRMAEQGITAAEYRQPSGKVIRYSIEAAVRRDVLTAVDRLANDSSIAMADELSIEYVEVSSHLGARTHPTNPIANHAGWQGKIYKIHGSDAKYGNLRENTGYPDDFLGLGGVNCRHRMYPFIPGISVPGAQAIPAEENERVYNLTKEQRAREREIRKLKKRIAAAEACGDKETAKKLKKRLKEKQIAMNEFCKENGLKRDWNREMVTEEVAKKSVAKGVEVPSGKTTVKEKTEIPEDIRESILETIDEAHKEYEFEIDEFSYEDLGDKEKDTPFQFVPRRGEGGKLIKAFVFNRGYNWGDGIAKFEESVHKSHSKGFLASRSLKDLVYHEVAHFSTFGLFDGYDSFESFERYIRGLFIPGISSYNNNIKDGAETIAEGLVAMRHGEAVDDGIRSLVEYYVRRRDNGDDSV